MVREVAPHFSYPGTVEIIREAIRRLAPEEKWVSPYGDCVEICECKWLPDGNPSSGFGDWALRLKSMDPKDRGRCAAIHARLAPEGQRTNVMYRDGRDLAWFLKEPKLVGEVFEDFLWAVFRKVHWIVGRRTAQAEGQVTTPDGGGGSKPRGKNIDTVIKVAKARLIVELKGHEISQRAACDRARTSPKTLRKYQDDPDVLDELERLRQDRDFLDEIGGI